MVGDLNRVEGKKSREEHLIDPRETRAGVPDKAEGVAPSSGTSTNPKLTHGACCEASPSLLSWSLSPNCPSPAAPSPGPSPPVQRSEGMPKGEEAPGHR